MTVLGQTFDVASDENLIRLINRASRRLAVICPALSEPVAKAIEARLDQGFPGVTIIVDADPEVYRLGYGTEAALDLLRAASNRNQLDLRVQPGVRIGVVISDDMTMVFSPVPLFAEAGSTLTDKPNAVVLSGAAVERLAEAAGAGAAAAIDRQEIGKAALTPARAEALKVDLKANPPQPFNLARALRVFTAKVQYVEILVENCRLSSRQVRLPKVLLDISDDQLRDRISSTIRIPTSALGPFSIMVETSDGDSRASVDDDWVKGERKRIEDRYTYLVARFGRVIFSRDREPFGKEIERFRRNLEKYRDAALGAFEKAKTDFEGALVKEYMPKWRQKPPNRFAEHGLAATEDNLRAELQGVVESTIRDSLSFEPPVVRLVYKAIALDSIDDGEFRGRLEDAMRRKGVPGAIIRSLFTAGDAAPTASGFESV